MKFLIQFNNNNKNNNKIKGNYQENFINFIRWFRYWCKISCQIGTWWNTILKKKYSCKRVVYKKLIKKKIKI